MTFRRRVENIREAGFNFQEAAGLCAGLFLSSLSSSADSSCARRPGVSFDLARATRLPPSPSPSPSLLLLLPAAAFIAHRYCRLSGRRFWQSSAPVSQLIRGCCYFCLARYTIARLCDVPAFSRNGFLLLRDALLKTWPP